MNCFGNLSAQIVQFGLHRKWSCRSHSLPLLIQQQAGHGTESSFAKRLNFNHPSTSTPNDSALEHFIGLSILVRFAKLTNFTNLRD
jgi:hypothetical protein